MILESCRFTRSPAGIDFSCCELECRSADDFLNALGSERPAALVVRDTSLEHITCLTDLVVDRGAKHKARSLSQYLLDRDRIPAIRGSYTDVGQLRRSVRTLLTNAADQGEENAYIIGVNDAIFGELMEKAGGQQDTGRDPPSASVDGTLDDSSPSSRLLTSVT